MSINRQVLKLAIPSILANITIPLVGLVDMTIIGHISDAVAIGGIAIGTMLFDLLYWNFGFLRVGTSGMTAQAYGARRYEECSKLLLKSLTIAIVATILIWTLQWLFIKLVFFCVHCTPEVASFAKKYFFIRIWAALAVLCLKAIKGWLIGMQDTVSSMAIDITINVVNIVASYVLAIYTPLGVWGVAYGTLIAQYTGLSVAILIWVIKYRHLFQFTFVKETFHEWRSFKQLLVLNANLYIRSVCFIIIYVGFTALAAQYGNELLAVSNIMMKLFMLFSHFIDGFAYAAEALVGKYIGFRCVQQTSSSSDLPKVVCTVALWSLAIGVLFSVFYAVAGANSIGWITTDNSVIEASKPFIGWLIAMPFLSCFAFMWDGVFIGATAGRQVRDAMIWAVGVFVLAYVLLAPSIGLHALFLGYIAHLVARVIYLTIKRNVVYTQK